MQGLTYFQVTFGPTEGNACQRHGFSISVNNSDVVKAVSRENVGDQDCSAFVASQDVSTVVALGPNDFVSLRTLYPRMTIFAKKEYTFWGIVQLR